MGTLSSFFVRLLRKRGIESAWKRMNASTATAHLDFEPGQTYTLNRAGVPFLAFKEGAPGEGMILEEVDHMTPEGKVKKRVKDMLDAFGAGVWYTSPLTAGFGNSGTPDILACCWGHFLAIECKAGNNTVTALQQQEIDRIVAAGGEALVINERNMEVLAVVLAAWNPQNEQA